MEVNGIMKKKNFSYCLDFSFACSEEGQVKDEEKWVWLIR